MNGIGGQLHSFCTWPLYGGKWSARHSGRFASREELSTQTWATNPTWIFWRIEIFLAATKILTSVRPACKLTLSPLTWKIRWVPNNASRWQMGFKSAFKGLTISARVLLWPTELALSVSRLVVVWMTVVWFRTQWGRQATHQLHYTHPEAVGTVTSGGARSIAGTSPLMSQWEAQPLGANSLVRK